MNWAKNHTCANCKWSTKYNSSDYYIGCLLEGDVMIKRLRTGTCVRWEKDDPVVYAAKELG